METLNEYDLLLLIKQLPFLDKLMLGCLNRQLRQLVMSPHCVGQLMLASCLQSDVFVEDCTGWRKYPIALSPGHRNEILGGRTRTPPQLLFTIYKPHHEQILSTFG